MMNWLKNESEIVNEAITVHEETIKPHQDRLDEIHHKIQAASEKAAALAPISRQQAINSLKLKKLYESHAEALSNQIFTLETKKANLEQASATADTADALKIFSNAMKIALENLRGVPELQTQIEDQKEQLEQVVEALDLDDVDLDDVDLEDELKKLTEELAEPPQAQQTQAEIKDQNLESSDAKTQPLSDTDHKVEVLHLDDLNLEDELDNLTEELVEPVQAQAQQTQAEIKDQNLESSEAKTQSPSDTDHTLKVLHLDDLNLEDELDKDTAEPVQAQQTQDKINDQNLESSEAQTQSPSDTDHTVKVLHLDDLNLEDELDKDIAEPVQAQQTQDEISDQKLRSSEAKTQAILSRLHDKNTRKLQKQMISQGNKLADELLAVQKSREAAVATSDMTDALKTAEEKALAQAEIREENKEITEQKRTANLC